MKKTTAILATLALATGAFAQGSLTPPGAPAPTMKTLEQVEPRTDLATVAGDADYHHVISQPGSYYLSSNLAVTKTGGIQINAAGMTLDLNGFEISRASGVGGYGVYIYSAGGSATVRNGSIAGFSYGINSDSTAYGCLFEKLVLTGCTDRALYAGDAARIIGCRAYDNPGSGVKAGVGSTIQGCTVEANQGEYGILASLGSIIDGCTVADNECTYAIYGSYGSTISGCVAYLNTVSYAIYARGASTINDCTVYNNRADYGIFGLNGASIRGCVADGNTGSGAQSAGLRANTGSIIIECLSRRNGHTNSMATASQGMGIYVNGSAEVKDCTAYDNSGDGIRVSSGCSVVGNTCDRNGDAGDGAGIHATLSFNRIENNNVTRNDRGIDVDYNGNFIVRNTASGNSTNYIIVVNNKVGVIVSAPSSSAISGSTGGAGVGTTDPWANFSY